MAATDAEMLLGIRTNVRAATGESTTAEVADATLTAEINAYYTTQFIKDAMVEDFEADLTQDLTATDSGEYALTASEIMLENPVLINGSTVDLFLNKGDFWAEFPTQETYITPPTLSIGVSSAAAVTNAAFDYQIKDWSYSKATAETALSGDNIPQSKYGAWKLTIDSDGTITLAAASANGTGYATAAKAVYALLATAGDSSCLGYVTAIDTSGAFVPGTTDLDASNTTVTYTDGDPKLRGQPYGVLVDGRTMYVRPKPNDKARLTCPMVLQRPTELSGDTDAVFNEEWGYAIAYAVSEDRLMRQHDAEGAQRQGALKNKYIRSIEKDLLLQLKKSHTQRAF